MPDPMDVVGERNRVLIQQIYSGALDPSQFNDVFRAWDDYFHAIDKAEPAAHTDFRWMDEIVAHFETAGAVVEQLHKDKGPHLLQQIHDMAFAALVCDPTGKVVSINQLAARIFGPADDLSIQNLAHNIDTTTEILSLARAPDGQDQTARSRAVVRLFPTGQHDPEVFLADRAPSLDPETGQSRYHVLLRSLSTSWSRAVIHAMQSAFGLTPAEIALVENLYQGKTIKETAVATGKSAGTLRVQLHSVLAKTDTRSQADLLRIVSGLVQVLHPDDVPAVNAPDIARPLEGSQRSSVLQIADGTTVEVVELGDLGGQAVYSLFTSSAPLLGDRLKTRLAQHGLRLVAPLRSGNGATTRRNTDCGPAEWAPLHGEVLEQMGIPGHHLLGHRCGGVYALHLARYLARTRGAICKSVCLADTGAPKTGLADFLDMPAAPKRLFMAARYFPLAIRTPIKLVAADFFASQQGANRAVTYFYDGSPADQAIVNQSRFWSTTHTNIEYCLRNPLQTAQDVVHWSQDFSAPLRDVVQNSAVHFFHGACNTIFRPEKLRELSMRLANTTVEIVPDRGQLLIYAEQDRFVDWLARQCRPE